MELVIAMPGEQPGLIVCVGEGMLELAGGTATDEGSSPAGGALREGLRLGYGGDTLNSAIHLARDGHHVAYLTALGADPFSHDLRARWQAEGLDCDLVLTHPSRSPGLYAISTDALGERRFTYWRDASAARMMFALPGTAAAVERAEQARLLAFSAISLAILPPQGREALLCLAERVRARGGAVAFDSNYRPALWESHDEARFWHGRAVATATIGLPTLEDETALLGIEDPDAVAAHWRQQGCAQVIVKLGGHGCRLTDGWIVAPEQVLQPVDTSGAGDAFNAGFLGALVRGASEIDAARAGHARAGWTIMRRGAIPARDS